MPVLAIALNPTIDVSRHATRIHPTVKVRTHDVQQRPGGGGVNVAAVIATLGGSAELEVLAGGATGAMLKDALAATAIRLHPIMIAGPTRIAFIVREEETGLEYRFVPEGPEISAGDVCAVLQVVDEFKGNYLVASGSLPRNAPADVYAEIARCAAKNGSKVILDCPGTTLRDTLGKAPVFLIKPSLEELEVLAGVPVRRGWRGKDGIGFGKGRCLGIRRGHPGPRGCLTCREFRHPASAIEVCRRQIHGGRRGQLHWRTCLAPRGRWVNGTCVSVWHCRRCGSGNGAGRGALQTRGCVCKLRLWLVARRAPLGQAI